MADFDDFWEICVRPRKGKGDARKAWAKAVLKASPKTIMAGYRAQIPEISAKEVQYRKHPATWLNKECWDDDVETAPTHQRAYNDWTDAEKQREAAYVAEKGIDHAVRAGMLRSDIERLTNEGYLGPGKVAL